MKLDCLVAHVNAPNIQLYLLFLLLYDVFYKVWWCPIFFVIPYFCFWKL